jgi:hypothetical protein
MVPIVDSDGKVQGHRDAKTMVKLTRSDLVALLKRNIQKPPPNAKFVVVEVEKGDELINVNDVDGIVISWG